MMVKLGKIWVDPSRVDAILPPELIAGDPELVTQGFFHVAALLRETQGSFICASYDTFKEALEMADAFAAIINSYYQPSYPHDNTSNP